MAYRVRTVRDADEYAAAISAIGHYFGWTPEREEVDRFTKIMAFERLHAVFDDGRVVAGAGVFPFPLTVPAGMLPCAGVSVVGVLPTHRRRGLLRRMMDAQLDDIRERGEPIAALWASEETIYGRFGYGLASVGLHVDAERKSVSIRPDLPRDGTARLVSHEEALAAFPKVYDRVARDRAGMVIRSRDWWETRRLDDAPERRRGAGPLVRVLFERGGRAVGYALYRLQQEGSTPANWKKTIRVLEAFGIDSDATRDVWRYLLEIDWVDRIAAFNLPVDHPLPLLVDRFNKLHLEVWDGLWVRLVDVTAALTGRRYAALERVTIEVTSDPRIPDNVGSWTIEDGTVRRARRRADVRLPVDALASAYLGGFSFAQLVAAGRAVETTRGGAVRADSVFRTARAPWTGEMF
jgi:predicted acetyltransferase